MKFEHIISAPWSLEPPTGFTSRCIYIDGSNFLMCQSRPCLKEPSQSARKKLAELATLFIDANNPNVKVVLLCKYLYDGKGYVHNDFRKLYFQQKIIEIPCNNWEKTHRYSRKDDEAASYVEALYNVIFRGQSISQRTFKKIRDLFEKAATKCTAKGRRQLALDDLVLVYEALWNDGVIISNDKFRDLIKYDNQINSFLLSNRIAVGSANEWSFTFFFPKAVQRIFDTILFNMPTEKAKSVQFIERNTSSVNTSTSSLLETDKSATRPEFESENKFVLDKVDQIRSANSDSPLNISESYLSRSFCISYEDIIKQSKCVPLPDISLF